MGMSYFQASGVDGATAVVAWLLTYGLHSTFLLGLALLLSRVSESMRFRDLAWKVALVGGLLTATLQQGLSLQPLGGTIQPWRSTGPVVSVQDTALAALTPIETTVLEPSFAETAPVAEASPLIASSRASAVRLPLQWMEAEAEAAPLLPAPVTPPDPAPAGMGVTGFSLYADAGPEFVLRSPTLRNIWPFSKNRPSFWENLVSELSWARVLVGLWLVTALMLVFRYGACRLKLFRQLGRREPVGDPALLLHLQRLCRTAGLMRPIRLTRSEELSVPISIGRSEICLPERAVCALSSEQQEGMLAHELAHLVRRDPSWLVVCGLFESVFFFQPLNRLARRRFQAGAEFLCDDWAVRQTGRRLSLAKCLVEVAGWLQSAPPGPELAPAMAAQSGSPLVLRVQRLLKEPNAMNNSAPILTRSLFVAALLAGTVWLAPTVTADRLDDLPAPPEAVETADLDDDWLADEIWEPVSAPEAPAAPETPRALEAPPAPPAPAAPAARPAPEAPPAALTFESLEAPLPPESAGVPLPDDAPLPEPAPEPAQLLNLEPVEAPVADSILLEPLTSLPPRLLVELPAASPSEQFARLGESEETPQPDDRLESNEAEPVVSAAVEVPESDETGRERVEIDTEGNDSYSMHVSHNGVRTMKIRWSDGSTDRKVEAKGKIRFNDEETDLESISSNGWFRLEERQGGRSWGYEVQADRRGDLTRTFRINGRKVEDGEARAWLEQTLPQIIRETGIDAERRVLRILNREGPGGVLDEISRIRSNSSKHRHFKALFEHARLSGAELQRAARQIGREISSDSYKTSLLLDLGDLDPGNAELQGALLDAGGTIDSDSYQTKFLGTVLDRSASSPAQTVRVLEIATKGIGSDSYMASLLSHVSDSLIEDASVGKAFLRAAETIDSDSYQTKVLLTFLRSANADADVHVFVLQTAAQNIGSDSYLASLLKEVEVSMLKNEAVARAFFEAARSIDSDSYQSAVLKRLLAMPMSPALRVQVLESAARTLSSDSYMASTLDAIEPKELTDESTQAAYVKAMQTIDSDSYLSKVLLSLAEHTDLSPSLRPQVLQMMAENISSDSYMAQVLVRLAEGSVLDSTTGPAFFSALRSVESDSYSVKVLRSMITRPAPARELQEQLLRVAAEIVQSDTYMASYLLRVLEAGWLDDALAPAFLEAAERIESDSYLVKVLRAAVDRSDLGVETRLALLRAGRRGLGSDSALASFLVEFLDHTPLTEGIEAEVLQAMDSIGSGTYLKQVFKALQEARRR